MGFKVSFPRTLQQVSYYARGPRASYVDRLDGEDFGIYETQADSLYERFAKPQSNGNHLGLRWLTLADGDGKGVRVETEAMWPSRSVRGMTCSCCTASTIGNCLPPTASWHISMLIRAVSVRPPVVPVSVTSTS